MRSVRQWLAALMLSAWSSAALSCCSPEGPEEFIGPFANWATCTGLSGNGSTNDATALQTCINNLSTSSPTMWLPAPSSCYAITAELTFTNEGHFRIIGASPATTSICWTGSSGGNMFLSNGSGYSRIARLTFNGETTANVIMDQSRATTSTGIFDTENQYFDDVFENATVGLRCGFAAGAGCAEAVPLRTTFSHLTAAGIALGNFNALDLFPWYSTFTSNAIGVTNAYTTGDANTAAGNFSIYESYFNGSTTADITTNNTDNFNVRWNTSLGSNQFISGTSFINPCPFNIQGNIVLDPTVVATAVGCIGPVVAIDNVFRSTANATGPALTVSQGSPTNSGALSAFRHYVTDLWRRALRRRSQKDGASIFSLGNTFSANPPVLSAAGEIVSLADTIVPRNTLLGFGAPTLPGTPPNNTASRTVTEVTAGSSSSTIQTDITNACTGGTTRPVVHLQAGSYASDSLTVPANCDIQIIGDGDSSQLTGAGSSPVITCAGPNYATLRDFQINADNGVGLTCSGIDTPGGRVFAEGLTLQGTQTVANISFNGLAYTTLEAHNLFQQNSSLSPVGIAVVGPTGAWGGATVNIFAGVSYGLTAAYTTSGNAHLIVRDTWYDNGVGGTNILLGGGSGAVTTFGGTQNSGSASAPAFSFSNFTGFASVIGTEVFYTPAAVLFASGVSNDTVIGSVDQLTTTNPGPIVTNNVPASNYAFLQNQTYNSGRPTAIYSTDVRNDKSQSFLLNNLNQARTLLPTVPGSPLLPPGATDLRLYRITIQNCSTCLSLNP